MKTLGSLFLIFTIVYTTIGVRINEHYCIETNATNYSLFQPKNCCHQEKQRCSHQHKIKDCCIDHVNLVHLGQDIHFSQNTTNPSLTILAFSLNNYLLKSNLRKKLDSKKVKGRSPPILYQREDRQALNQVYII